MSASAVPYAADQANAFGESLDYVTVTIGGQLLGLPIRRVRDVFIAHAITVVPTAPPEIVGLLNLRGRIVTAICLRRRLGLPAAECGTAGARTEWVAIGIDHGRESYALVVDAAGEVMHLPGTTLEAVPAHLDPVWAGVASGVHRLRDRLLVALDVDALLGLDNPLAA